METLGRLKDKHFLLAWICTCLGKAQGGCLSPMECSRLEEPCAVSPLLMCTEVGHEDPRLKVYEQRGPISKGQVLEGLE